MEARRHFEADMQARKHASALPIKPARSAARPRQSTHEPTDGLTQARRPSRRHASKLACTQACRHTSARLGSDTLPNAGRNMQKALLRVRAAS
eukprot:2689369-Pleurochrysis_carterae.AAC.1